jgi:hypothetical protein
MNDLEQLLAQLAEAKKQAIENHPGKKLLLRLQEDIKNNNPFLSTNPPKETNEWIEEEIVIPDEPTREVVGEFLFEDGQYVEPQMLTEVDTPEVKPASQVYSQAEIDKYLRRNASFQQPDPDKVDPNFKAIQEKIKFLEQSIGKIAALGPGSGETKLRYLDDINRSSIQNGRYLRYDQATSKFTFDNPNAQEIGVLDYLQFNLDGPGDDILFPGTVYWNVDEKCLDVIQEDNTTLQLGLEQYIQVRNDTGSTLTNGTVVRFSGAYSNGDYVPQVVPHLADGTVPPLYTVGVVTSDIVNSSTGRATVLGKVRDTNTTGSDVGEVWNEGDILYVHPTLPGKMTKFKPTAPQIVVSVAAVLKKDATTGILLVRPTIFPRLHYGTFADKTNQIQTQINTPKAVTFDTTEVANGFRIGTDTSHIIAENSGLYNFKFSIQLASTSASAKDVWIWFRKNGVDIPDSATRKTITGNNVYDVAAWDISPTMQPNDYFQIMWAVSDTGVRIVAPAATAFCPAIPSVLLTVSEIAL